VSAKLEYSRGERIADKYEVVDLLGSHPLGLTYRAKHTSSGHYVQVTLLRPSIATPERAADVKAAYEYAKSLDHKSLIRLGELSEHDGVPFFVTEDMEAKTLREVLQEHKIAGHPLGLKEASQIIGQVLEVVQLVNQNGRPIRALRPEYVYVSIRHTGPKQKNFVAHVKLFGIGFWDLVPSGVLAEDEFSRSEAQYLAPELKSFQPTPTERSDVYSVGVMFYEMLVGTAPIGTFQLPRSQRPDLPDHVDTVIELALAHSPEDRYQTARDCGNDVQRIFEGGRTSQDPNHGTKLTIAILSGVAAAFLVLGVMTWRSVQHDPAAEAQTLVMQQRASIEQAHPKPTAAELQAVEAQHPENMAYIPAGPYLSGKLPTEERGLTGSTEPTAKTTDVSAFLIDRFEYPNVKGRVPVHGVSHAEAEQYCEEAGKRLCSANEWEKACKGHGNLIYAYGDTYDDDFCGVGNGDHYASGDRSECNTDWRVYDMSGNFREWTSTVPQGSETRRIVKDGLRTNPMKGLRCASFSDESVGFKERSLSFRCCLDVGMDEATE
jgi:serine/threonine protein kinase